MRDTAPVWTTPVDESPTGNPPAFPYEIVRCQCPREGYVLKQTLGIVAAEGFKPEFVCRHCAAPEIKELAETLLNNATPEMHGATVKVVIDEEEETWHRWTICRQGK